MRSLIPILAALIVVASGRAAQAAAATPAPLDLPGAVRYALNHDPTILNQRATVAQDEATYAKNHAAEFPSLAGSLQNQLLKSNGANPGIYGQYGLTQAQVYSQNTAQIASTWNIYNGSLSQIQAQEAKRQIDTARSDLRRAEQQLASDVAAAWYNVVQQRQSLVLAAGDRTYQQQLLSAAQAQEKVGRVAGVDVLRAEVNELRSEATEASARAAEANSRESLAQRIGAPLDTAFALPVQLPEPPLPQTPVATLIDLAMGSRSDVAAARAQVSYAELTDEAIESDRLPQIQLTGSLGNSEIPTTQTTSAEFIPGYGYLPPTLVNRTGFWQIGATSTWTVPLIEYGQRRAAHRAARAQVDAALATLASDETQVALDVRQALRAVETAHANLITSREAEALGTESARIAQLQYRNGVISLTDATSAEQSSLSAANDLVAARVAYINALVHLRVSVGIADPVAIVELGA